jgi:hypothetical protein
VTATGTGRAAGPDHPVVPSGRGRPRWLLAAMVAIAVLVGSWWFIAEGRVGGQVDPVLQLTDHGRGEVVFERPVDEGELFRLEHAHSVTGRPVIETFSIREATIALEELWFDEFGPNLPAGPERIGDRTTTMLRDGGGYRVLHHGHPIGAVPLRVGSEAVDHTVRFADGERLRLLDVAPVGAYVEFNVTSE